MNDAREGRCGALAASTWARTRGRWDAAESLGTRDARGVGAGTGDDDDDRKRERGDAGVCRRRWVRGVRDGRDETGGVGGVLGVGERDGGARDAVGRTRESRGVVDGDVHGGVCVAWGHFIRVLRVVHAAV